MSSISKTVYLLGYASGTAAADAGCCDGPLVLEKSPYMAALSEAGIDLHNGSESVLESVTRQCQSLAAAVAEQVKNKHFFTVFGGDHSCAIGTWSGVYSVVGKLGDMGMIWIDAHMDSHTPATSMTGNVHGMPLACLMGHGHPALINILSDKPKLKPEHVCIIGVRSYESGEAELLRDLGVRVFFIEEVQERGLAAVMTEALAIANKGTIGYGLSIDIDSIDPVDAPGTGVSEPNGLSASALCEVLKVVAGDERLLGTEIVEFDPHRDHDQLTEKLVPKLMAAIYS
jgi:arginase